MWIGSKLHKVLSIEYCIHCHTNRSFDKTQTLTVVVMYTIIYNVY